MFGQSTPSSVGPQGGGGGGWIISHKNTTKPGAEK